MTAKYQIEVFDPEREEWKPAFDTDYSVRVISNQFASHIVFESDDPEYNG